MPSALVLGSKKIPLGMACCGLAMGVRSHEISRKWTQVLFADGNLYSLTESCREIAPDRVYR
jgi:hypothetical protein